MSHKTQIIKKNLVKKLKKDILIRVIILLKEINTIFKWKFGGNNVFITGTMTGWKNHIEMSKIKNEFECLLVCYIYFRESNQVCININLLLMESGVFLLMMI